MDGNKRERERDRESSHTEKSKKSEDFYVRY